LIKRLGVGSVVGHPPGPDGELHLRHIAGSKQKPALSEWRARYSVPLIDPTVLSVLVGNRRAGAGFHMFDKVMTRRKGTLPLLAALAVDMLGTGLFTPISLLYFPAVTGLPLTTVGLLMSAATISTLPVPVLIGYLADRWNPRDLVLIAQVLQAIGFLAYLWVRGPLSVLAVVVIVAIGQRVFWSSFFTVVAGLAEPGEDDRLSDQRLAMTAMVQAAGTGLGALIGGLALIGASVTTYRAVALIDAVTFAVSAVLMFRIPRGRRRSPAECAAAAGQGYRVLLRDRPYLMLIGVNTVFALCSMMIGVAVPVYLIKWLPTPDWFVGLLLAFNTLLSATAQTFVVRGIRRLSRVRAMALAAACWVLWSILFALALQIPKPILMPYLVIGIIFFVAADLIHYPTSMALATAAAPEHVRGRYLAVFQYCFTIAGIVAPTFFTALSARGAALPWLALAALAAAAAIVTLRLEKHLTTAPASAAATK
jgi:MFS family permease